MFHFSLFYSFLAYPLSKFLLSGQSFNWSANFLVVRRGGGFTWRWKSDLFYSLKLELAHLVLFICVLTKDYAILWSQVSTLIQSWTLAEAWWMSFEWEPLRVRITTFGCNAVYLKMAFSIGYILFPNSWCLFRLYREISERKENHCFWLL